MKKKLLLGSTGRASIQADAKTMARLEDFLGNTFHS